MAGEIFLPILKAIFKRSSSLILSPLIIFRISSQAMGGVDGVGLGNTVLINCSEKYFLIYTEHILYH